MTSARFEASDAAVGGIVGWVEALRDCWWEKASRWEARAKGSGPPIRLAVDAPCRATPLLRSAVPNCRERSRGEGFGRAWSAVSKKPFEWIVGRNRPVHDLLLLPAPTRDLIGEGFCWEASCLTVPCWYSDAWVAILKAAARQNFPYFVAPSRKFWVGPVVRRRQSSWQDVGHGGGTWKLPGSTISTCPRTT